MSQCRLRPHTAPRVEEGTQTYTEQNPPLEKKASRLQALFQQVTHNLSSLRFKNPKHKYNPLIINVSYSTVWQSRNGLIQMYSRAWPIASLLAVIPLPVRLFAVACASPLSHPEQNSFRDLKCVKQLRKQAENV